MSKSEFLLLIPGLIYGVGLVELMRILNRKIYWEILAWSLIMFISLIVQWFGLYDRLESLKLNIGVFSLLLINPSFSPGHATRSPLAMVLLIPSYISKTSDLYFYLFWVSLLSPA